MQTLQRKRCQTRTRPRKKGCAYGAGVSGATIYSYVGGNPLSYTDPMGLQATTAVGVAPVVLPAVGAACSTGVGCAAVVVGAVGVGSYWLTDRYVNPWAQPLISKAIDACTKDSAADCDKEWREAFATCHELIREQEEMDAGRRRRRSVKGVTGGYKDVQACARGLVSETCGGNLVKR